MVELPLKRFSNNDISTKYCCRLTSDSEFDDKIIRQIATAKKCTKICKYKICAEHLIKYEIRFGKTEDKDAFIEEISSWIIREKLKKKYA
jgi:hypothetical protein